MAAQLHQPIVHPAAVQGRPPVAQHPQGCILVLEENPSPILIAQAKPRRQIPGQEVASQLSGVEDGEGTCILQEAFLRTKPLLAPVQKVANECNSFARCWPGDL